MSNHLLPDARLDTVFDIDLKSLRARGIRAFIFDIDNTLATYAMPVPDEKTAQWLRTLVSDGFGVYLVSNNNRERVAAFAQNVGVPYTSRAAKPLGFSLRRACRRMGVAPVETALVGDQLFTDILGGNLLNMYTILVTPISEAEDGFVRFKRKFEKKILEKTEYQNRR